MTGALRALTNLARAASAGESDVESLVGRMCGSVADSFGLERIDVYRYDAEREDALLLSGDGAAQPIAQRALFREALETGAAVWRDGELVVPLPSATGVIGFLTAPSAAPLDELALELLTACGAVVAVSLQRALEREELERVGRLKSNFIALASHELRTPATVVHGIAKTIEQRSERLGPEQIADLQHTLVEHTERLTRLIDELLDISRLEAKGLDIRPERVRVRTHVEDVVRAVAGDRAPEVAIEVDPNLTANVDRNALDRIVSNLVTNAIRYGGGSAISIRAHQQDRHFRLTVEDRGDGVAPGFVPRLFDRFSRESGAMPKIGAGLGLSIAQSYAQAHGGQLFYEDASPSGARFQLVLPSPHE